MRKKGANAIESLRCRFISMSPPMSWIEDEDINIFPVSPVVLDCVKSKYSPALILKLNVFLLN